MADDAAPAASWWLILERVLAGFAAGPGGPGADDLPLAKNLVGRSRFNRKFLILVLVPLAISILWAGNAWLDEVVKGQGQVVPLRRGQVIQNFEGGILRELKVSEGDNVSVGQELLRLDQTRFQSAYDELRSQELSVRAALARLDAEFDGAERPVFDDGLLRNGAEIVEVEQQLFGARRRQFSEKMANIDHRLTLAKEELSLIAPLARKGVASRVDHIRLKKSIADLEGEKIKLSGDYRKELATRISELSVQRNTLLQQIAQKEDQLRRTVITSPVKGTVNNISVTTVGGVIDPGENIMEIVPSGDQLIVEAKIRPQDVAFIATEMPAIVKLTAYDFTRYGSLSGHVSNISADTLSTRNPDEEPFYKVRIVTDKSYLVHDGSRLPIKPGMVAEVDIKTGKKTVLDYLLKPIRRGAEAMRER